MREGWQTRTLGEICDVVGGGTPSKKRSDYYDHGTIPWATVRDMNAEYLTETEFSITQAAMRESSTNIIPANNVVIATRVGLGKVCLLGQDTAINQDLKGILPKSGVDLSIPFLFRWFQNVTDRIVAAGTGATVQGVKIPFIKSLEIPVPSRAEQHRIVAILDEAFAAITTAKANAEKNLQNAREVFESQLSAVFLQQSKQWKEAVLGDACTFVNGDRGKNYPNRNDYATTGIPWINAGHILDDGTISSRDLNFITKEKFDSLRSGKVQVGDIIYCLRGTLGKIAIVENIECGAIASSLVIIRPSSLLNNIFLYFYLSSPVGKNLILRFQNGTAQPNLGARSVAKYPIPLPPLEEQERVAEVLARVRREIVRVSAINKQKLGSLDELKQSLLHQAFTGALTAKTTDRQLAETV